MGGPRMLFAGGEDQDVTRCATGIQQQVDRFLGGVERTGRRGRDQLDLRCGTILRRLRTGGGRSRGGGVRALRRGRGARGRGPDGRDAGWPLNADRVRDEGSARCGRRPE
ncbi:hypothetical protein GCM10010253_62160 [Streptomyces badius]|uniref:Uncharacterized protein n=1 Tax=Streptomyces badius TaxID=1941 RepID=A0ABQ2TQV2_STRBA|nr:hypothetical protein GCM10010253_62160 [Streptomyces badius]